MKTIRNENPREAGSSRAKSAHPAAAACSVFWLLFCATATAQPDTCLAVRAVNLADNLGNSHIYVRFDARPVVIQPGDRFHYDVFLDPSNPVATGGVDIEFPDKPALRDSIGLGVKDQNGLGPHGETTLTPAVGKWYSRDFPLEPFAGATTNAWTVFFEGKRIGAYTQFVDNVAILHADGKRTVLYDGGTASDKAIIHRSSFSRSVVMTPVPRDAVRESSDFQALLAPLVERQKTLDRLDDLMIDVDFARRFLGRIRRDSPAALTALDASAEDIRDAVRNPSLTEKEARQIEKGVEVVLDENVRSVARRFTGHLVGHAHIDAQWLWEWPETVQEFRNTFRQALVFMEEFDGFTFTQSSSMFYQQTEYQYPDLFKEIQKRVREGRWELVGGRITESDNNLISPEAHAREFLYGQRFFRERFEGKQAVVAWEPDTFGHNAQMPQIVRLGGCEYYYFCRAGRDIPLFQWEGLDGSRVLTFQEIGSWYNDSLNESELDELSMFESKTGTRDMLWVYGVGDHGGGPTREDLNIAVDWKKKPYLPVVKFSTATEFFRIAEKTMDPKLIPTVVGELNFVFRGCYTTHGDIKRLNDEGQALVESSESMAAVASRYGFAYPGTLIRQIWEDICWNHHHDTIDGSAIHAPYRRSREVAARSMGNSRLVGDDALGALAERIDAPAGALIVFNPTACRRDAAVECLVPSGIPLESARVTADANSTPIQVLDPASRLGFFIASHLPPCGYRVYRFEADTEPTVATIAAASKQSLHVSSDGRILENSILRVELDPATGAIARLLDKREGRELVAPGKNVGRFEIHWEKPSGMPAWDIGEIDHVDPLDRPEPFRVVESGPNRVAVEIAFKFRSNRIVHRVSLSHSADSVESRIDVDWKETGFNNPPLWPLLRVAFDFNVERPVATYEIPFGTVTRPLNGEEVPALKWVDLGNGDHGVSVLCDDKHGWSATSDTLRLSLVRAPTWPDPTSDNYSQTIRLSIVPHAKSWIEARATERAFAFLHPAWTMTPIRSSGGPLPDELSFVSSPDSHVMITAVKRAEDDDDLIVRLYETQGCALPARVRLQWPAVKVQCVNFLEDPIPGDATVGGKDRNEIRFSLRPHEIKTLKVKLKHAEGVELTGTRGSEAPRSF